LQGNFEKAPKCSRLICTNEHLEWLVPVYMFMTVDGLSGEERWRVAACEGGGKRRGFLRALGGHVWDCSPPHIHSYTENIEAREI